MGADALQLNTTGNNNTAIGVDAGRNQTTGSSNVYIGAEMQGVAGESNACYIASIFSQTSVNGVAVLINSNNKLWDNDFLKAVQGRHQADGHNQRSAPWVETGYLPLQEGD
jgi:hypothetical protein